MNDTLVCDAQHGDQQAFAKLVEEYYRPIYGLAFSAVGNWQAAEDVAQDAFLVAWANMARLRTLDAFGAWLRRIARNLACNWIRSEYYRRALLERREVLVSQSGEAQCAATENLARADAISETWAALATLSPPLREAVVLYYLEENSIAQTAAMLGVTENSVKKRLQHARPKLRRYFEKQWKAEMERERRRVKPPEAGARFLAGAMLGPVSGLTGQLGTGAGLWLHSALHGEGAGRLASMLSLDSVFVRPAAVVLMIVAVSGGGLLWNVNRQGTATNDEPPVREAREPALPAAPAGVAGGTAVRVEETYESDESPGAAFSDSVSDPIEEVAVPSITIEGHVIDEQQQPIEGATVTVVAVDLVTAAPGSVAGFGGGGGVGMAGGFGGGMSGGQVGQFGGGDAQRGGSGGVIAGGGRASTFALRDLNKETLNEALLDETRRFSGETSSDGSFTIPGVPAGGILIASARAPGYCIEGMTYPATEVFPDGLTLTLSPGVSVDGRLLNVRGLPVGDALLQVTALTYGRGSWSKSLQQWAWTTTDDQGLFTVTVDEPGNAVVVVRSLTQGEAAFSDVRLEPGTLAELRFPAYAVVCGQITRHDGAPASGCLVRLTGYATIIGEHADGYSSATWGGTSGATYSATTDAEGAYRIEGVDPQLSYSACVYDADETPLATDLELGATLAAGNSLVWNCAIPRPITVKGVVKERTSGRPAVGATIVCKRAIETAPGSIPTGPVQAVTGADGAFEMRLTAGADTYAFGVQAVTEFLSLAERELRDGESAVVNLVLPGAWSRNFLVIDESGNPLSGVSVCIETEGNTAYGYPGQTDAEGRIRVTDFATGKPATCRFECEGNAVKSESVVGQDGMDLPEETIVMNMPV